MKPILHGLDHINRSLTVKVPVEKINYEGLIYMLEGNLDKAASAEFVKNFHEISTVYNELFTDGQVSEETLGAVSYEIMEIACESIQDELEDYFFSKRGSTGREYFYEFSRSIGMELQVATLKEHLSDECDFI